MLLSVKQAFVGGGGGEIRLPRAHRRSTTGTVPLESNHFI